MQTWIPPKDRTKWKDTYQSKVIKDEEERVLVEDIKILERWSEYYQKPINEENPREGRNEQQVEVEGDIREATSAEIEIALRNTKNGKATGPENLPVEVGKRFWKNWSEFSEGSIEQDH